MIGKTTVFDFVVVGAGSSGAVVASRLSENPNINVALIEAGDIWHQEDDIPEELRSAASGAGALPGHPNNWSFIGELTPRLIYSIPRGMGAGGSSSINGTYFVRGTPADFAKWARSGNSEWSYDKVLPYFRKFETDLDYGGPEHGHDGPVLVSRDLDSLKAPVVSGFYGACLDLGFEDEPDKNAGAPEGIGPIPRNVSRGKRISTAISHLLPALARSNLSVFDRTIVHRVLIESGRAIGVEAESEGSVQKIYADEVILAAGSIKSPHILMLSGVGPESQLRRNGIPLILRNEAVGANFMDHPHLNVSFRTNGADGNSHTASLLPVALNFTSEGSESTGDMEICLRLAPFGYMFGGGTGSYLRGLTRMAIRPIRTATALQGVSFRRLLAEARHQGNLSLNVGLQQEESRGSLSLRSRDPEVQPQISYNYLTAGSDLRRLREGVRVAVEILSTRVMRDLGVQVVGLGDVSISESDDLDGWIARNLTSALHLSASCRMGVETDDSAVVDQRGRVFGVEGLSVADTSIMPSITSRGTAATATMIGERIVPLLLDDQ